MTTTGEQVKEKPPGLMSSNPVGALALLAVGTGVIALVSIGVELWTDQALARTADFGVAFISAPLGAATAILAALTAKNNIKWALPALVCAAVYWLLFVFAA